MNNPRTINPIFSLEQDRLHSFWAAALILAVLVTLFHRFLHPSSQLVLSMEGEDLSGQFVWWRQFGFEELVKDDLAPVLAPLAEPPECLCPPVEV